MVGTDNCLRANYIPIVRVIFACVEGLTDNGFDYCIENKNNRLSFYQSLIPANQMA